MSKSTPKVNNNAPVQPQHKVAPINKISTQESEPITALPDLNSNSWWHSITRGWIPYVIIAVFGLLLNANTFHHEYALDDDIIVCKNEFVLKGLAGLDGIFKYDVFESFYRSMNTTAQLTGGRYRPFSVATYALEQEFIGTMEPDSNKWPKRWDMNRDGRVDYNESIMSFLNDQRNSNGDTINQPFEDINKDGLYNDYDGKIKGMGFRHVNNVLLYVISVCCVFLFLSTFFFRNNKLAALLISLLFLAHPIHTEVVANVKSRDEILSLLFMVLTLHNSFLYAAGKKTKHIVFAALSYMLALLSKEYGATLLIIVPISLYVYHNKRSIFSYMPLFISLGAVFLVYYIMRSTVVIGESNLQNTELLNNPFLFATDDERRATQLFINLKYLYLLLIPTPLSCDYSYNVIPFRGFGDIGVLCAGLFIAACIFFLIRSIVKRSWLFFPLAFALTHLFLVDNLFFNIGATMGERLVYHSSLGTCILMVWGLHKLFEKIKVSNATAYAFVLLPVIALYGLKTFTRNPAWKNDITLHLTDVKTYPESTMLNGNACTRLIELSEKPVNAAMQKRLLDSAKIYGYKSLQLHDRFVNSYLNMGIIAAKQQNQDSAAYFWGKVREYYPHHPQLQAIDQNLVNSYYQRAQKYANVDRNIGAALAELQKAEKLTPQNANLLFDIGVMLLNTGNYKLSKDYLVRANSMMPGNPGIQEALGRLQQMGY